MPIYEYRCDNGHLFEVMQSISDEPMAQCTVCSEPVQRVFHPVAVHFKGSGFYNTDYGTRKRAREKEDGSEGKTGEAAEIKTGSEASTGGSGDGSTKSSSSNGASGDGAGASKGSEPKPSPSKSSAATSS